MSNFLIAQKLGLNILPVINKIDVSHADLEDLIE